MFCFVGFQGARFYHMTVGGSVRRGRMSEVVDTWPQPLTRCGLTEMKGDRVLARQRQEVILREVDRIGGVRVSELVGTLGVSDMTVRRDIEVLASNGLVLKVHGGAAAVVGRSADEPGFHVKSGLNPGPKSAIARAVAGLISPGSSIAISAGTTTYAVAQELLNVPELTVVTNSPRVADLLHNSQREHLTVVLTGGVRTPPVRTTVRCSRWALCSRSATLGEFVTTVSSGTLSSSCATAYVVVPAEMAIDEPGEIRPATARAMADFGPGLSPDFTWNPGSSALRPTTAAAPPWTFRTRPLLASTSMSRRTVMSETPRVPTSSDTRTPPMRSTSRRITSCRCRASTRSPFISVRPHRVKGCGQVSTTSLIRPLRTEPPTVM